MKASDVLLIHCSIETTCLVISRDVRVFKKNLILTESLVALEKASPVFQTSLALEVDKSEPKNGEYMTSKVIFLLSLFKGV